MKNFIRKLKFEFKTLVVGLGRPFFILFYKLKHKKSKHLLDEKKVVIYTSLYGDYDQLSLIKEQSINVDWICFTDKPIKSKGWKCVLIDPISTDNRRAAKWFKINASKIKELDDYDYTIYIDASTEILTKYLAEIFLSATEVLGFYRHPQRSSFISEAEVSSKMKKYKNDDLMTQAQFYFKKMDVDNKLWAGGVIVRKSPVPEFEELWWSEMSRSLQDQISLPYAVFLSKTKITSLPSSQYSHVFLRYKVMHRLGEYETI